MKTKVDRQPVNVSRRKFCVNSTVTICQVVTLSNIARKPFCGIQLNSQCKFSTFLKSNFFKESQHCIFTINCTVYTVCHRHRMKGS